MPRDILTTVIGAYPYPDWLGHHPTQQALADASAAIIKTQELAGLDLLADGELARYNPNHPESDGKIDYFIRPLRNIRTQIGRSEHRKFEELTHLRFRAQAAGVVEGQIGEGTLNLPADFAQVRKLTARPLKFTVTSPYMLGRVLLDRHYQSKEILINAIADVIAGQVRDVDAEVLQVNDEIITGNASDGPWVAEPLNRIFSSCPRKSALHMCFGNYNGQVVQQGNWSQLIDFINLLHVDHVLLELAHRGTEELSAIKDIKPAIGIGIGVVDVKTTKVEPPDQIARNIEYADKILGPGRLKYVTPDCGFWMHKRSVAEAKIQSLIRGRDLFLADSQE